jgi:hypothetical protein
VSVPRLIFTARRCSARLSSSSCRREADRYAAAMPDARVVDVDDCYSFTPEDQSAAFASGAT